MKEVLSEWSDTIFLITTYESDAADLVLPVTTDPEFMTFNFIVLLRIDLWRNSSFARCRSFHTKRSAISYEIRQQKFNR